MAVPEATIHKYHNLDSWQHRIGRSRKVLPVTLWLVPKLFEQKCQTDLRGGVLPLDLGHDFRTFGFTKDVSHRIFPCDQNVWWDEGR
jgi:hypothetical protein